MKKLFFSAMAVLMTVMLTGQSANLKLNLEKNKVYRLRSVSEQTVSQTINGNQQSTDSKIDYTFSLKMIDLTPGFMVTEIHFDTLITTSNTMGKVVNINSSKDGDIKSSEMADVLSYTMNRLSKNPLFVKMDFTGKPLEIVNQKMLSDQIVRDTSAVTLTGAVGAAIKTQIVNTVSDNSLKTMIESFTWCLPGKEVKAGDNWSLTQMVNSGGMMLEITTDYHLAEIKGNNANITSESNIRAALNALPIKSAGATVTYDDLKGLSKSTLVIDTLTGLIIDNSSKTHISGTLGISGPGFSMQMPMDINGESKTISLK